MFAKNDKREDCNKPPYLYAVTGFHFISRVMRRLVESSPLRAKDEAGIHIRNKRRRILVKAKSSKHIQINVDCLH